jgi:hypothetical protein
VLYFSAGSEMTMERTRMKCVATRVFCRLTQCASVLLLWGGAALGLSMLPVSPIELARQADEVVIVEVVDATPETTQEGAMVERLALRVVERWKGGRETTLMRRQLITARHAETGAQIEFAGVTRVQVGETWLLFLDRDEPLPVLGLSVAASAGAFRAQRVGNEWRFRTAEGQPVLDVAADALSLEWQPPPSGTEVIVGVRTPTPEPTPALSSRWRALVRGAR